MKSLQKISANAMQKHANDAGLFITIDPRFANTTRAHFPIFDPKEMVKVHAAPPFVYVKKPYVVTFRSLEPSTVKITQWKPRKLKTIMKIYNAQASYWGRFRPGITDFYWRYHPIDEQDLNTLIKADETVSIFQAHLGAHGWKRKYQSITRGEHRRMETWLNDPLHHIPPFMHRK